MNGNDIDSVLTIVQSAAKGPSVILGDLNSRTQKLGQKRELKRKEESTIGLRRQDGI